MTIQTRKKQALKRDINKSESIRQYHKRKCLINRTFELSYQKAKYQNFIKKSGIRNVKKRKKVVIRLKIFFNKQNKGTVQSLF